MAIALEELHELTPRPPLRLVPPASDATMPLRARQRRRHLLRRRRLVAVAAVLLLALALSAVGRAGADDAAAGGAPIAAEAASAADGEASVIVGAGDTLWDIARANVPAGTSVAVYAEALAAHNGVDARAIRPGDVVRLP